MVPHAKALLSKEDLAALGEKMATRKAERVAELKAAP